MSRNFLLSLIVIAASLLGWLVVEERQRTRALVRESLASPVFESTSSVIVTAELQPATDVNELAVSDTTLSTASPETVTPTSETNAENQVGLNSESTTQFEQPSAPINNEAATSELIKTPSPDAQAENASPILAANNAPAPEATATTDAETTNDVVCSSFDNVGLLATFDGALASFIAEASALYGSQYENLQYQLSSKSGVLEGDQGTVTTTYTGTVQELSTGQDVSANGIIRATFSWDGCTWQVVDYSF